MIIEQIFDVYISIFYTIGVINLLIVCIRRRDLIKYLPAYITNAIGYIFYTLHYIEYTFRLVANICFLITAFFAFISFYFEYHLTFSKNNKSQPKLGLGLILTNVSLLASIIISLQIVIIIILIISSIMMIRIFLVKKTTTYLVLILLPVLSLIALLSTILNELNIYGAWELSYIITILLASIILIMPIIAYAEDRILKSEKNYREAYNLSEFYKNLLAHDIRNILQNIGSSSEIIALSPKQNGNIEKSMRCLQVINEQVMRGTTLVSNIYRLSQLSEAEVEFKHTKILSILNESVNFIKNSFSEKNIVIELNSEYEEIYAKSNDLISGVFQNILINAVTYNKNEKIEIQVSISKIFENTMQFIKIEIKDNGIGIPDDLKEKLFLKTIKSPGESKGLGLGLMLVYKIMLSYNGKIWVEDRIKGDYTKGSNFILLIPEAVS